MYLLFGNCSIKSCCLNQMFFSDFWITYSYLAIELKITWMGLVEYHITPIWKWSNYMLFLLLLTFCMDNSKMHPYVIPTRNWTMLFLPEIGLRSNGKPYFKVVIFLSYYGHNGDGFQGHASMAIARNTLLLCTFPRSFLIQLLP